MEIKTGFILRVKIENTLSTGEVKLENTSGNFLTIWEADGRKFDAFNKPIEDNKYLFDFNSNQSFEYVKLLTGGTMSAEMPAGRYYLHIQTASDGRYNRTAGYIDIEDKNDMPVYEIIVPDNDVSYSWIDWKPTVRKAGG